MSASEVWLPSGVSFAPLVSQAPLGVYSRIDEMAPQIELVFFWKTSYQKHQIHSVDWRAPDPSRRSGTIRLDLFERKIGRDNRDLIVHQRNIRCERKRAGVLCV
jgi:hypothetical protein